MIDTIFGIRQITFYMDDLYDFLKSYKVNGHLF